LTYYLDVNRDVNFDVKLVTKHSLPVISIVLSIREGLHFVQWYCIRMHNKGID